MVQEIHSRKHASKSSKVQREATQKSKSGIASQAKQRPTTQVSACPALDASVDALSHLLHKVIANLHVMAASPHQESIDVS
jgi:hypothetical protein